jgi:hypothetical protein
LSIKENIICVLKYLKDDNNFEIIEIFPIDSANILFHKQIIAIKYYFIFKLDYFKSYKEEPQNFDISKILVSLISKNYFNKNINEAEFMNKIDIKNIRNKLVLPYSLITYQKPNIIESQKRSPNVAVCGAQFYGEPSRDLYNWIDYQQSFGIAEIMIYDGTINKTTTKFINNNFQNYSRIKLSIVPDQSLFYDQCNDPIFYKQFKNKNSIKLKNLLLRLCNRVFRWSHRSKPKISNPVGWSSDRHRIIVFNDCFIKMSRKYEFVAIYDFDEFIFPRTFDLVKDIVVQIKMRFVIKCHLTSKAQRVIEKKIIYSII